jgi:hypothetical protein
MFDNSGLVIGMVDLKAEIEGAGFVIPANDVIQFLVGCSSAKGDDGKLLRHWVDSSGTHQTNARFAGYAGYAPYGSNIVRLERADGSLIRAHIKRLSEADKRSLSIAPWQEKPPANVLGSFRHTHRHVPQLAIGPAQTGPALNRTLVQEDLARTFQDAGRDQHRLQPPIDGGHRLGSVRELAFGDFEIPDRDAVVGVISQCRFSAGRHD